jgi:hypothetical protein
LIRWLRAIVWLCGIAAFAPAPAQDQRLPRQTPISTASAQGIFRDSSGLGLGAVAITLRNLDTGQTISAASSGDGVFRILNLPPGRYSLRAERDGFQSLERSGIVLNAGEIFAAEFAMLTAPVPPRPAVPEPPLARSAARGPAGRSAAADHSSQGTRLYARSGPVEIRSAGLPSLRAA